MKTIIIYASMTGTTEMMVETIADELTKAGNDVTLKDAFEAYAEDLTAYERILVGCYTWDEGALADELLDFYNELESVDLTGKMAAAFGPGSTAYEHFAKAVDLLEEGLQKQGCEIITDGLKIDTWSDDDGVIQAKCIDFANKIISRTAQMSLVGAGI